MFGDSILVAPVFHESSVTFYIPEGRWTCFWTGESLVGPRFITKTDYPLDMIPVFVRPNSVLLLGPEDVTVPDYEYSKVALEVREYELENEVGFDVPVGKGSEWAAHVRISPGGQWHSDGIKLVGKE